MPTAPLFVGIDLAWAARNRTGLAATDDTGRLICSAVARSDDDIAAWLDDIPGAPVVVGIDAPLAAPNQTGRRAGENEIARAFGRYRAGPHSSNRSMPWMNPPRAETLADRFGWSPDPDRVATADHPQCLEVYPHPAMVGLFGLGERILYKKGPDREAGFRLLVQHFETIEELRLPESDRWRELAAIVDSPGRGDLTRIEDEIDAILCAHLAWLWHHRRSALQVYGTLADGYIVAAPPPTHPASPR